MINSPSKLAVSSVVYVVMSRGRLKGVANYCGFVRYDTKKAVAMALSSLATAFYS